VAKRTVGNLDRERWLNALGHDGWNIRKQLAKRLGLAPNTVYARLRSLGIRRESPEVRRQKLLDLLARCGGKVALVAEALRVSRQTVYNRLHRYGISLQKTPAARSNTAPRPSRPNGC
jgi:transcriptional regulator of acetoin/glycerol metabolism